MLAEAEGRLIGLRTLEGRLQYQIAGAAIVLLLLVLLLSTYIVPRMQTEFVPVLLCGAIGGFLSVSIGLRKLKIDPHADWRTNAQAGISRIVIAMLASVFMYFAMEAGLLFSALQQEASSFGVYAASVIAGFSETLIPNAIRRVEADQAERSTNEPPRESE
jgi:hypothetical protein